MTVQRTFNWKINATLSIAQLLRQKTKNISLFQYCPPS